MNRPRVLLADDHGPMIERVKALLEADFEIVGNVDSGTDLVSEARRLQPDIILLDISMPGLTGIEAAHELRKTGTKARFVFLTVHERVEFVHACLAEGHAMKEVGGILNVSEKTVMFHKYHIMRSLNLRSNAELVLLALNQGLISA